MIAEEENVQIRWAIIEQETQFQIAPKFKNRLGQFPNAQTAMKMWATENLHQIRKGQQTFASLLPG